VPVRFSVSDVAVDVLEELIVCGKSFFLRPSQRKKAKKKQFSEERKLKRNDESRSTTRFINGPNYFDFNFIRWIDNNNNKP
jgi:hypothetical protein